MRPVADDELDWIRRDTPVGMTLASAIPSGFAVYGVLDIEHEPAQDLALLAALAPDPDAVVVAGRLVRSDRDEHEPGTDLLLYAGWHYRVLRARIAELRRRIESVPPPRTFDPWALPELLFPPDRSWLVSTLWDDSWRSVGIDEAGARRIEDALPAFERVGRDLDLRTTGRELF